MDDKYYPGFLQKVVDDPLAALAGFGIEPRVAQLAVNKLTNKNIGETGLLPVDRHYLVMLSAGTVGAWNQWLIRAHRGSKEEAQSEADSMAIRRDRPGTGSIFKCP